MKMTLQPAVEMAPLLQVLFPSCNVIELMYFSRGILHLDTSEVSIVLNLNN